MNPTGCLTDPAGCPLIYPSGQAQDGAARAVQTVIDDYRSQITMWKILFGLAAATAGGVYLTKVVLPGRRMHRASGKPMKVYA